MPPSRTTDLVLLLLRLCFGGLMLVNHGWGKAAKLLAGEYGFPDPLGIGSAASLTLATFAEVVCAFLVMIGLFTRLSVIPLIVTMLVAVFIQHWGDPFTKMESGLLYLIPYICLLLKGPGSYSVDGALGRV